MENLPENSEIQFHQEQIAAAESQTTSEEDRPDPIVIITPSPTTTAVKSESNQANRDATKDSILPGEQAPTETQAAKNVKNNLSVQEKRRNRSATTGSVSSMDPTLSEEAIPHRPTPARAITPNRELTIVITGIKGAGKSTLISILFDKRADIQTSPDSITTDFDQIKFKTKNDTEITIIDTPGIELLGKKHRKQFKRLSWHTENKADIVLHCIPVSPQSKFEEYNLDIIKNLQSSFGDPIWKKCIVVFTFSNYAKNRLKDPKKYKQHIQAYADKYQRALKDAKIENIEVKSILDYGPEVNFEQITDNTIIAIPAGDEGADIVTPEFTDHWVDLILKLMIKKIDPECTPDLLKYSYDEFGTKMGGSVGSAGIIVGGTLGAVAGAAAGTPLFGVGAGPGAIIGGIAGIAMGAVVGVGAGGVTGVSGPSVYHKTKTKAEQRRREVAQEGSSPGRNSQEKMHT